MLRFLIVIALLWPAISWGQDDMVYEQSLNKLNLNVNRACRDCNLSNANFRFANLSGVKLTRANLSGADLREADLYNADLSEADLDGANLAGAILEGVTW